jgi:putative two-component system response regulator
MDIFQPERPHVLYVACTPARQARFSQWLQEICSTSFLTPELAVQANLSDSADAPKLIMLDADLPDAPAICSELRQNPTTIYHPLIALGSRSSTEKGIALLESGACDFISEPIERSLFLARIRAHLMRIFGMEATRTLRVYLEHEVSRRCAEVARTQQATLEALSALAGMRDNSTGQHILRTQHYVRALARHLGSHPRFSAHLTPRYIDLLFRSAPLHDIGKVGIPDHILLKPGRLTPEEMSVMKTHPMLGLLALENAERQLGWEVDFLSVAKAIAYCHHERWDGTGYPRGLKADAIPISARLMAVADVYDAIVSRRVYKDEMSHDKAVAVIIEGLGSHFDPDVVTAFVEIEAEFRHIAERYKDGSASVGVGVGVGVGGDGGGPISFTRHPDPLLSALQTRVDSLPGDVVPFVVAILKGTSVVPRPLAMLLTRMLASKASDRLGPVHHALVQMFSSAKRQGPNAQEQNSQGMALLLACRGSKAANDALSFVLDLPSLLHLPVPMNGLVRPN